MYLSIYLFICLPAVFLYLSIYLSIYLFLGALGQLVGASAAHFFPPMDSIEEECDPKKVCVCWCVFTCWVERAN